MLLFVYTTTRKRFVIFTCRYFKLNWNTTALSQSNCSNFSCSSINSFIKPPLGYFSFALIGRCIVIWKPAWIDFKAKKKKEKRVGCTVNQKCHGNFNFTRGNFNLLTTISIFSRQHSRHFSLRSPPVNFGGQQWPPKVKMQNKKSMFNVDLQNEKWKSKIQSRFTDTYASTQHSSGWGRGKRLFEFDWEEEGVGAYSRLGANSRLGTYSNKYGIQKRIPCFGKGENC